MRHIHHLTTMPAQASDGVCGGVNNDLQARLCFVLEFLTNVFVPLFQPFVNAKVPSGENGDGEA